MVLKRRIAIVPLLFIAFFASSSHAFAATWYANSSTGSDTTGDGSSGNPFATFSKAYNAAAASGDTINLTGTFNEANQAESSSTAYTGFDLNKNLTIVGQGIGSTIVEASSTYGTANRSVFTIPGAKTAIIKNMTIRYGVGLAGNEGAGITNDGTLTLTNVDVTNNYYNNTGNYGAGGIYTDTGSASTTVASSTVENNHFNGGYYGGGGFFVLGNSASVNLTILNSTVSNNFATTTDPTAYEYAGAAGGIETFRIAAVTIANSTIAHNTTNAYAGGLMLYLSSQSITNSTIADNYAAKGGGGIVWTSTTGDKLYLENDLLAGNVTATTTNDFYAHDAASATVVQDNGYNSVGYSTAYTFSNSRDITGASSGSELSSTLAANGSTQGPYTLALLSGSPEINAGTTTPNNGVTIQNTDERGATRNGAVDIGAFEYGGGGITGIPPDITVTASSTATSTFAIAFNTSEPANTTFSYGTTTAYTTTLLDTGYLPSHSYSVSGLMQSTTYHFQLTATDQYGDTSTSTDSTFLTSGISGPTISSLATSTNATSTAISFLTSTPANVAFQFGTSTAYGSVVVDSATTSHAFSFSSLTPSTTYHFEIIAVDSSTGATTTSQDYVVNTIPDTVLPELSGVAASPTATGAVFDWETDKSTNSYVTYGLTTSYGMASSSAAFSYTHALYIYGLTPSTTYHFKYSSTDAYGNAATSSDMTFTTPALTPPTPSSVSTVSATHSVQVIWDTPTDASSQVVFGPISTYSSSSPITDTPAQVVYHTVTINGLIACTLYHYAVTDTNAGGASATSTDATFTTTGCTGGAAINSTQQGAITVAAGGTVANGAFSLNVPTGFTGATSSAVFEIHDIDRTAFFSTAGTPTGKQAATSDVFTAIALATPTINISTFTAPLTTTLSYTAPQISGLDPSSLWIYRYDSGVWTPLDSCTVNTGALTVTCNTSNFSDFALFGNVLSGTTTQVATATGGTSYGGGIVYGCKDPKATNYSEFVASKPSLCVYGVSSLTTVSFTRNLQKGMSGTDVTALQNLLISANSGSAAQSLAAVGTSTYFGALTKAALIEYQKAKGISPTSGYFGPLTRAYIVSL